MEEKEYEKMYSLEDTYWWFQGRKSIIFSILEKYSSFSSKSAERLLDLGCGTGLILSELNNYCMGTGVDFSQLALTFCKKRGLRHLVCADVQELPFGSNDFNLIVALDLLEHIESDLNLMKEMHRICRPGGMILLTVPAYNFLWSEHDEALHHFRRYTRRKFHTLITTSGFEPVKFSFCISFMLVPIVLFRLLQKVLKRRRAPKTHLIVLPGWLNSILIQILKIEARLLRHINLPFGVSLICLARKK